MNQKTKTKFSFSARRGSVLAYSLIILSVMLMIAVGISSVSIVNKKSASTTEASVQALQVADSGVQWAVKQIENATDDGTKKISQAFPSSFCTGNTVNLNSTNSGVSGGTFQLFFLDINGDALGCNSGKISKIDSIKSVGIFENTTRAVMVALTNGKISSKIGAVDPATFLWWRDSSGNGSWLATEDVNSSFGTPGDIPVTGDWNNDGYSEVGIFRNNAGAGQFWLDTNADGQWIGGDTPVSGSFGIGTDIPVSGDFDGNGVWDVGVFRDGAWFFDRNSDRKWVDADDLPQAASFGSVGQVPVTGNWDGESNGKTKIGTYLSPNKWFLDLNDNRIYNPGTEKIESFVPPANIVPITGDWNGDGKTEIGGYDKANRKFYLDYNGNFFWDGEPDDKLYTFGSTNNDIPVSGAWKP